MGEASQIAGFGKNRQREDRPHPGQGAEALIIRVGLKALVGLALDRRSCGTQPLMLGQDQPEHLNGFRVLGHRQADALTGRGIEVIQKPPLVHLAAHDGPGLFVKGLPRVAGDGGGTRKPMEELRKPLSARVGGLSLSFRKIQRQIVGHNAVLDLDLAEGDEKMGLG